LIVPLCQLPESGEGAGSGTILPGEAFGTISGTIGSFVWNPKNPFKYWVLFSLNELIGDRAN